jgi:hypothetical protein
MSFKNRVIERRKMRVGDLAENPRNPKTHPVEQRKRMRAVLDELGIVTELVAYYRDDVLTLFDGHLRSQLDPDQEWDVAVTDLSQDEVDRLVLFYDPLAGLAERDEKRWQAIVDSYEERNTELAGWLEEMRGDRDNGDFLGVAKDAKPNPRKLPIDVIFCWGGGDNSCCLAVRAGWKYGVRSGDVEIDGKGICPLVPHSPRHKVVFVDNDFHDYDHEHHAAVVKLTRPKYATVRDIMSEAQCKKEGMEFYSFERIMDWAAELEEHTENVIVIPKYDCLDKIPERYMLGYSVPTRYGGTPLPVSAFNGRRVHLLGGSWKAQLAHMTELGDDVVSLDNNEINIIASRWGQFCDREGNTKQMQDIGFDYLINVRDAAMVLSIGAIGAKVNELYQDAKRAIDLADIRQAVLDDINDIKETAKRYTHELGFILRPVLEEAVSRQSLLYHPSGAFCHYRRRKDGVTVIYEICTPVEVRGQGLARAMINKLKRPIQLKCPIDNQSNAFYAHLGFEKTGEEKGKKRKLNVWRLSNFLAVAATRLNKTRRLVTCTVSF